MRLASFALASSVLAALATVSACAPYAGSYGYAYQTTPVVGDYGYADPTYAQPYYASPYASPYYAAPVGGAVIIGGGGGWDRGREGWREDRRPDRRYDYRREEGFRGDRYGGGRFGGGRPEERQRPVFANQPAPMQPPRAAASPIPPPPSGGRAFEEWSRRNVNSAPSPTDNGSNR